MSLLSTRAWNVSDSQPLDTPRYNSYTPINSKCLSITRREAFLLHYAQLRAQLLWITLKLLLWDYCNHMWHLLSHFPLFSQKRLCRRNCFTLCHCKKSHYLQQLQPEGCFCPCIRGKPAIHLWSSTQNLNQDHSDATGPESASKAKLAENLCTYKFLGEFGSMRVHRARGGMAMGMALARGDSPHGEPREGGKVGSGRLLAPPATAAVSPGAQLHGRDGAKPRAHPSSVQALHHALTSYPLQSLEDCYSWAAHIHPSWSALSTGIRAICTRREKWIVPPLPPSPFLYTCGWWVVWAMYFLLLILTCSVMHLGQWYVPGKQYTHAHILRLSDNRRHQ